jgi:N-acetylglucosamine-6-sulfatase
MTQRRTALLAPPLAVAALLAGLWLLLERGAGHGIAPGVLEAVGVVAFALLLLAPWLLVPLARRAGAPPTARAALALLPAFVWWLGQVGFRLGGHPLPEALWLSASPVNLLHLYLCGLAVATAEAAVWAIAALRGGATRPGRRPLVVGALFVLAGPLVVLGSIPPFLGGYRALFQHELLPEPDVLPGPLPAGRAPAPALHPRPNLVFILSDDHRWDFAGYEGHPFVETPSLDRLAAEGVRFSRAYVTSSLCSPSRASYLTGTHPHRHGVWNNFTPWSDDNRTFLEHLSRAGYATAFIGKWHMPGRLPELRGVDHFVTFTALGGQGIYEWCPLVVDGREEPSRTRYIATELTDRALAWLDRREAGRPFALYLSHKSVHAGFLPDEPDRGLHADAAVTLPPDAHPWSAFTKAQYVHLIPRPLDDAIRRYAEAVHSLDREIGRVLDYLDAHGLREDTVVIYASDNGYLWGERGLVDKRWPWETSIRVPFLLRYPASGHAPGVTADGIVANVDVAPTLLDLAGLPVPERMQGRSLRPMLADPGARVRDALLYTYWFEPPYPVPTAHAVVTDRYKWIELGDRPPVLYDLAADPHERDDLGGAGPRADALRARLRELREEAGR